MINLDKINSQLDIKNLDTEKLTKLVIENQNVLIKIILVVGALYLSWNMFNDFQLKNKGITAKIALLEQKMNAVKARDAANQDLDAFKSAIAPKINEFELITLLSNYAKKDNVNITSLSPAESKDMGLYDAINVNFSASSKSFKEMMHFLRKIEKSKSSLRINTWSGHEDRSGAITITIEISAVMIHP